jgi:hypothetical protein
MCVWFHKRSWLLGAVEFGVPKTSPSPMNVSIPSQRGRLGVGGWGHETNAQKSGPLYGNEYGPKFCPTSVKGYPPAAGPLAVAGLKLPGGAPTNTAVITGGRYEKPRCTVVVCPATVTTRSSPAPEPGGSVQMSVVELERLRSTGQVKLPKASLRTKFTRGGTSMGSMSGLYTPKLEPTRMTSIPPMVGPLGVRTVVTLGGR